MGTSKTQRSGPQRPLAGTGARFFVSDFAFFAFDSENIAYCYRPNFLGQ